MKAIILILLSFNVAAQTVSGGYTPQPDLSAYAKITGNDTTGDVVLGSNLGSGLSTVTIRVAGEDRLKIGAVDASFGTNANTSNVFYIRANAAPTYRAIAGVDGDSYAPYISTIGAKELYMSTTGVTFSGFGVAAQGVGLLNANGQALSLQSNNASGSEIRFLRGNAAYMGRANATGWGIGPNPNVSNLHLNASAASTTFKITNNTTGHLAANGYDTVLNGNNVSHVLYGAGSQSFSTSNTVRLSMTSGGLVTVGATVGSSTFNVIGSQSNKVTVSSANVTLNASMQTVINTGASAVTYTLPAASTCVGRRYEIINQGLGNITLNLAVIIGGAGQTTSSVGSSDSILIISDGTSWRRIK